MEMIMRKDVPQELTWDLSLIYPTEEAMQADADAARALADTMVERFQGKLTDAKTVNDCLDCLRTVQEKLNLAANYCDLTVSVDFYDSYNQQRNDRISQLYSDVMRDLSFVSSELSQLPDAVLQEAMAASKANRGYLSDVLREKPYQLSPETEKVMKAMDPILSTPYQVYNMAKLADMKFPPFTAEGKEYPLGYSLYEDDYAYESNTAVRRTAFAAFSEKLREYENVTAAAYNAAVRSEKILSGIRGFQDVFDYLLFDQKVTREMYDRQIDLIMEKLAPHMRRYAKLLQKVHGLDKMTYADLKLTLDPAFVPSVTVDAAREYVEKGLSILGSEYCAMVSQAFEERWFDLAANQGKSTGGFCASPYGRGSFILLSFHNRMSDVFTMAHELGHAGHFKAANAAQSIFDTNVSGYFVEAPSTMNELLMVHYMLKTNPDPRFRRWVLDSLVGGTYYHNFVTHLLEAAYQREVYKIIDAGGSVQADTLNRLMRDTLAKFWGDAVELTEGAELTWMRQPHYYMGLYSYTYSAGLTVATQVCKRIEQEGQSAVDDWKKVLSAGSTLDPAGLAALAGVDISTPAPLEDTIATIGAYIDELYKLTEELEKQ